MIVIDSSVWIDHFNGRPSAQVARLGEVLADEEQPIVVGDIIMYEVLCGLRTDRARREVRELLEGQLLVSMLGFELVHRAVGHYRALRATDVTIKAADIFIATYCIANRTRLLTADADFLAIRDHLGLELA